MDACIIQNMCFFCIGLAVGEIIAIGTIFYYLNKKIYKR